MKGELLNQDAYNYIHGGEICPNCLSTKLRRYSGYELNGRELEIYVKCNNCEFEWIETYILTGYRLLEED